MRTKEQKYAYLKQWIKDNPEKWRASQRRWQVKNLENQRVRQAKHRAKDPHKHVLATQKYQAEHPGYAAAQVSKRKAAQLKRTPAWLTAAEYDKIAAMYAEAARLTRDTGVVHHVDHVVPLRGKTVSGLHIPENLQVIPATENLRKHARWLQ